MPSPSLRPLLTLPILLVSLPAVQGQPTGGPTPVRFTEVREHDVQRVIRLPGTVESPSVSLVAAEVAGRVAELPAREGMSVRRGEPLARLDARELDLRLRAGEARLKEARARLELAERNLVRARDLFVDEVIPQQDLDNATSERLAWEGRVEQYAAECDQIRLDLERSIVRAPFAGAVVQERTEVGEWLRVGDPVVELLALGELEVLVEVPERYYRNLDPGARPRVTLESLPGVDVEGRMQAIVPRADPRARTFPVKIRIPNREGRIGVGMLAQVGLPAGESYRATVVPKDAVITQGDQRFVYLIDGDDTVAALPVQPGEGIGDWIVVEGPLTAGARVITRGNERVFPGQVVVGEPLEYALP